MKFWELAALTLLVFFGLFAPISIYLGGEPHAKEPSPPPPPAIVEVSCEGPQGWAAFSAEKEKVTMSSYRSAGWRIKTINNKRVTATNCFMVEEEAR